jgi:hypothetical protein
MKASDRLEKKSGKYWIERQKGKSKKESALAVGLNPSNVSHTEKTENFLALEASTYKEEIIKHITMAQIAAEHKKVIVQDGDLGAKNTAIKLALERIEPDGGPKEDTSQKVVVVLR